MAGGDEAYADSAPGPAAGESDGHDPASAGSGSWGPGQAGQHAAGSAGSDGGLGEEGPFPSQPDESSVSFVSGYGGDSYEAGSHAPESAAEDADDVLSSPDPGVGTAATHAGAAPTRVFDAATTRRRPVVFEEDDELDVPDFLK
jgi:cell division protein FtsZ